MELKTCKLLKNNWTALLKQSQSENDIQVNSSFAILSEQQNECRNSCLSSTLTGISQSTCDPILLPLAINKEALGY